ncbi:HAD family phosphatase [Diaphorobacter sp. MNS-0]|uniref:HAD family hydrolase n=1 Tax=Diaphorobacter sp. MNS-0 TaxID=2866628 RepID=UPI001C736464|nr:HAD family hydrolase [Diaphorobacter sp. MNS-0]QYY26115.1 HAD-IB family hydrolase [Diaphorobacter sp. MNS-0]
MTALALFDLDHTLLDGDSDDLWCRFLVRHGLVNADIQQRNAQMLADYGSGKVSVEAYSGFYARLLANRTPSEWAHWQDRFLAEEIMPRLPPTARALVDSHRRAGHTPVLTTASNRVIAERTAAELGFAQFLSTELALANDVFTGEVRGTPNMRDGKLARIQAWLQEQDLPENALDSAWFYSDSINDLPLLSAVGHPVAVNPDKQLLQHALTKGWPVLDILGQSSP